MAVKKEMNSLSRESQSDNWQDIRNDLLLDALEIDRETVFSRLNTLNMIHHWLISVGDKGSSALGFESYHEIKDAVETTQATARFYYEFVVENRMAMDEVKSNIQALIYGRFSDAISMYEEYITKEDPVKDILLNLIPFILSTASEKSYISSAMIEHKGILESHSLHIYSSIYTFIKRHRMVTNEKEAREVGVMMEQLYKVLGSLVEDEKGIVMYGVLYHVIYNLEAQEVLNILNQQSEKMKTEA